MAKGWWFYVHSTLAAGLIVTASAGSRLPEPVATSPPSSEPAAGPRSSTPPDTSASTPQPIDDGLQPSESTHAETVVEGGAVVLADLPPAEQRTAFAISDEAAIIGGGAEASPAEVGPSGYNKYEAIDDVWLLDQSGKPTALPPLDTGGIKIGLSGVAVEETIVLGGQSCSDGMTGEFLTCWGPNPQALWMLEEAGDRWTKYELPKDLAEGVNTQDSKRQTETKVFGSFNGQAYIAITGDEVTRFATFNPLTGSFNILGDGEPRDYGSSPTLNCVTEDGEVIQPRALPRDTARKVFGQLAVGITKLIRCSRRNSDSMVLGTADPELG